jgi:hypothetical protein
MADTQTAEFWNWVFSKASDPGANGSFKSFNRKYKTYLKKHKEFGDQFRIWYENEGRM